MSAGANPGTFASSIRARLTISLGVIGAIVLAIAGSTLYLSLAEELARTDRDELHGKEMLVSHYIEEAAETGDMAALRHHIDDALIAHGTLRVWLVSRTGEIVLGSGALPRDLTNNGELLRMSTEDGILLEGVRRAVANPGNLPIAQMVVTIDIRPRLRLLEKHRLLVWIVCGGGVLLIVALAYWATGRGLAPARRLSAQAARIAPESLSLRLDAQCVDAELQDLVRGFNATLDRVETAYRKMEAFNADVAHELRTPLATLINAAEVTLADARSPETLRETLADQLEELEQLKALVNDMLFLARADQGDEAPDAALVELSAEARKTVEFYEALLSESGLSVSISGEAVVRCNAGLIRRALSNLVSNAIKQTSAGQVIEIRLRVENGQGVVEIFNPGEPIPDAVRARIFDRFYRADSARSRLGMSHGLGLAIVKAIVEMHRGSVLARAEAHGNAIGFSLPA